MRTGGEQPAFDNAHAIEFHRTVQKFGRKTPWSDTRKTVLSGVDFSVDKGCITCLLGPSGCGKTTMIDLIVGNSVPIEGEVLVLGERAPYRTARARVGYMPQQDALYEDITAEENLRFFGSMYDMAGDVLASRIEEMLAFARLEEDRSKLVASFSGGMKRRLSLAAALLHKPDVLVLDEPTVGLDPGHRLRIWDEFSAMAQRGVSILVTTHVMDEARRCDRIAMLSGGRIIEQGSPDEIIDRAGARNIEEAFLVLERAFDKEVRHV